MGPVSGTSTKRRIAVVAVLTLVVAATAAALAYRSAYGTFAWWDDPAQISWCGRTYLPGDAPLQTRAEVEQQRGRIGDDDPYPVVTVARIPPVIGRSVLASVTPPETRERLQVPCAMAVFYESEPDGFRAYTISGGP
jgi:hypothetical protein